MRILGSLLILPRAVFSAPLWKLEDPPLRRQVQTIRGITEIRFMMSGDFLNNGFKKQKNTVVYLSLREPARVLALENHDCRSPPASPDGARSRT
jgi:hypothetical protein